jgi:hypothetical protein
VVKTVTYGQLRKVLANFGYDPEPAGSDRIVFRSPDRHLVIILPTLREQERVRPIDLLRVQKTLANDGVIAEGEFDSLFRIKKGDRLVWSDPNSGTEVPVVAAAGESDGMVIVKQKGVFMACPVDQLRRDEHAPTNANGRR